LDFLGEAFVLYWDEITAWFGIIDLIVTVLTIAWVMTIKKEATSAVAWCLLVIFLPLVGAVAFFLFGYQHVQKPISRKARQKARFRKTLTEGPREAKPGLEESPGPDTSWEGISRLAQRFDAFPLTHGNHLTLYHEGEPAFEAMLTAVESARHHVHLEYFIFQPDELGRRFVDLLTRKAREGVEVRLVYDAMGSHRLHRAFLKPLRDAGGKCSAFLPVSIIQRRLQVNMRNHRKILVVDGKVAFTGGLNIGDEYLGKVARFGFWRDTNLRVEGHAVAALQRVFQEDWDFATGEQIRGSEYFPTPRDDGRVRAQVIASGPDQDKKGIREVYFAAVLRARERLWIATPYFVPDTGLLDALCLAGYMGVDVRVLGLFRPDKWIPYFAGRYYWSAVLEAGVKVYQYTGGMMHSKLMMVDGRWASIGTANLDNRSLHLNFEVNCLIDTQEVVAELEAAFLRDLQQSIRLDPNVYSHRPFSGRLVENACRLLSPVL
jgi:cardiolipin synthase